MYIKASMEPHITVRGLHLGKLPDSAGIWQHICIAQLVCKPFFFPWVMQFDIEKFRLLKRNMLRILGFIANEILASSPIISHDSLCIYSITLPDITV